MMGFLEKVGEEQKDGKEKGNGVFIPGVSFLPHVFNMILLNLCWENQRMEDRT